MRKEEEEEEEDIGITLEFSVLSQKRCVLAKNGLDFVIGNFQRFVLFARALYFT